jgi:hypothetical protein
MIAKASGPARIANEKYSVCVAIEMFVATIFKQSMLI